MGTRQKTQNRTKHYILLFVCVHASVCVQIAWVEQEGVNLPTAKKLNR